VTLLQIQYRHLVREYVFLPGNPSFISLFLFLLLLLHFNYKEN
jgi:hypothetical protein